MAVHGSLGLCHFFAGEHEEDILSMQQRPEKVQEGEVLAQHIHRLKCEHRTPFRELPFRVQGPHGCVQSNVIAVTTDSLCIESHHQVDVIDLYMLEKDTGHTLCVPLHSWVIWEIILFRMRRILSDEGTPIPIPQGEY